MSKNETRQRAIIDSIDAPAGDLEQCRPGSRQSVGSGEGATDMRGGKADQANWKAWRRVVAE